ncbi:MAG: hypothetical protein O7C66_03425 [Alphaproteobacteria bacterium]|nr:hypothetical protein [Alphaproteobacteria bacterium]
MIIALGVFLPSPSSGGPKSYDVGILLNQPHPFMDRNVSQLTQTHTDGPSDTGGSIAVSIFGGWMTDNRWEEVFTPWELDFRDSALVGMAGSRRIWRYDDDISFEIEGQIIRHFGDQDHWEFNLPFIVRWETFPWNDIIDTSVAFGLGPSYASKVPKDESAMDGESQHWLVYWVFELAMGLPETDWSGVFRLHHRSGAFGIVADKGGSNVLAVGLRRQF